MNPYPCFECNRLRYEVYTANVERRWRDLLKALDEQEAHQKECPVINGGWYKGLWPNARVAENAARPEAEGR